MLMSSKQFKILNRKLNAILQSQVDYGTKSSESGLEVEKMIKAVEKRIAVKVDDSDKNNELHIQAQAVKDLTTATKERYVLFVQDVKKVREDVNFKVEELKKEIAKELQELNSQNLDV